MPSFPNLPGSRNFAFPPPHFVYPTGPGSSILRRMMPLPDKYETIILCTNRKRGNDNLFFLYRIYFIALKNINIRDRRRRKGAGGENVIFGNTHLKVWAHHSASQTLNTTTLT